VGFGVVCASSRGSPIIFHSSAGARLVGRERPMIRKLFEKLSREVSGQGLAEYALILALVAIAAIIALLFLGGQVSAILSNVGNSI
jgi:pilus assembly protein Flp/PilA